MIGKYMLLYEEGNEQCMPVSFIAGTCDSGCTIGTWKNFLKHSKV